MSGPRKGLMARLTDKVNYSAPAGCWEWTGALSATGYGRFAIAHGNVSNAHRVMFEMVVGPIPAGLQVDHLCRNRKCVNPEHLEPVTQGQNVLRGEGRGARFARATECVNGHPFTSENTYVRPDNGNRQCRTCKAVRKTKAVSA